MLDHLVLAVKKSYLADITRFARYGINRGRDWYLRNRRLPRMTEFSRLLKRAAFEYEIRRRQGLNELSWPAGFVLPERADPYQCWLAANQHTERTADRLRDRLARSAKLPKISVLIPVYNPPAEFFELAVRSVRNQIYDNWELCVADDASSTPWVRPRLQELAGEDQRIRICFRERNGNISLASNSAAELATGEFLLFLDQDDLLTNDALAEVALHLGENDTVDVLYSDDDKIDEEGRRFAPQFKPDWSPELLLSYMYICHLFVVRRSLFEALKGFRAGFEGSQDYDLALRVTERARSVAHLPYILYHWRAVRGSTATRGDAKPASFEAGRKAVAEALTRRGVQARIFRPEWAVKAANGIFWHEFADDGPSVTILLPSTQETAALKRCVGSLAVTAYRNFDVVIVDTGNHDYDTLEYLNSLGCQLLKIQNPVEHFNFAYTGNRAVDQVNSSYVLFLSEYAEVRDPKWLSCMMGYAGLPGIGVVGARLLDAGGRLQHAGIVHGYYDGKAGPAFKLQPDWYPSYLSYGMVARNYSAVTSACLLTPRQVFLDQGGFDEQQFPVAYSDVDYCYRLIEKGLRCVYAPGAELYHHGDISRDCSDPQELAAFRRKYSRTIDPYYNPNLSLHNEWFEIQPRRLVRDKLRRPIQALMCSHNLNLEGAPYCQYELTLELTRNNEIKPVVYSPTDGPLRSSYEQAGIEVVVRRHPLDGVFECSEYDRAVDEFCTWITENRFQVVFGNTLQSFYAIDAAKRSGLPSLWVIKESEPWQNYFNYLLPPLIPRALSCFAFPYRIIFSAHATYSCFETLNTAHNFRIIRDGIDMRRLEQDRARWPREKSRSKLDLSENDVAVLLLGTVCSRKGQKDLVQAMNLLDDKAVKKARLFIVGDRPSLYSSELRRMAAALPKERAARISIVPETQETAPYYSAADVFVCTSRAESYPRVILEAMAHGLAIISTPVFGITEQMRDGVNGEFYQPGDVAELSAKLNGLVLEETRRRNYQVNASLVLSSLPGFDEMIESYAEVFRESAAN